MSHISQATVRNHLLRTMSPQDFALLRPYFEPFHGQSGLALFEPDVPVDAVYFPESGFASISTRSTHAGVEIGMIGREGAAGLAPVALGRNRSPHACFIRMPGQFVRLPSRHLSAAFDQSPTLRGLLLRCIHVLLVQTAQTAFSNAVYTIEVRLARWLLMCRDRGETNTLPVTHEFLSMMLGVRRPGVTVAVQVLEGNGLIRATRGQVTLLDRNGLEALAGDSYGEAEAEHTRLICPAAMATVEA